MAQLGAKLKHIVNSFVPDFRLGRVKATTTGFGSKCVATILGLSLICCGIADGARSSISQTDESVLMRYLQPVLDAGTSVRFSYAASCNAKTLFPPIPPISLSTALSAATGVGAVRWIFRGDYNVVITEGPSGIAKISVGRVPTDLLRTRVALLRLKPIEQYNPSEVIEALESTTEFERATKSSGLVLAPLLHVQVLQQPTPGAPHAPAVLHNVTVDQVLDLVARTYTGVIITYGVCTTGPAPRRLLIK